MRACLPLTCCVMKAAEKKKTRPASSLLTHSHARCSLPGPLCTLSYSVRQRASLRGLRCGSSWVNPNTNAAAIEPPNRGGTREPNLQRYIEVFPQLSTKAGGWGAQPPLPDAPKPHRSCNLRANQIEEKKGFPRVIPPPAPSHSFVWLLLCGEKKKKKTQQRALACSPFRPTMTSSSLALSSYPGQRWPHWMSGSWLCVQMTLLLTGTCPSATPQETLKIPPSAAGGDAPNVNPETQVIKLWCLNRAILLYGVR